MILLLPDVGSSRSQQIVGPAAYHRPLLRDPYLKATQRITAIIGHKNQSGASLDRGSTAGSVKQTATKIKTAAIIHLILNLESSYAHGISNATKTSLHTDILTNEVVLHEQIKGVANRLKVSRTVLAE